MLTYNTNILVYNRYLHPTSARKITKAQGNFWTSSLRTLVLVPRARWGVPFRIWTLFDRGVLGVQSGSGSFIHPREGDGVGGEKLQEKGQNLKRPNTSRKGFKKRGKEKTVRRRERVFKCPRTKDMFSSTQTPLLTR